MSSSCEHSANESYEGEEDEADRHEYSYYERCNREIATIRDYLVRKGFGVECAEVGVAEVVVGLLEGLFGSVEPNPLPVDTDMSDWRGEFAEAIDT